MGTPDTFRFRRVPVTQTSGAIPAVGFGAVVADPLETKQATEVVSEVGPRHLDCAESDRTKEVTSDSGNVRGGAAVVQ